MYITSLHIVSFVKSSGSCVLLVCWAFLWYYPDLCWCPELKQMQCLPGQKNMCLHCRTRWTVHMCSYSNTTRVLDWTCVCTFEIVQHIASWNMCITNCMNKILLEKMIVLQLFKMSPIAWKVKVHHSFPKSPTLVPVLARLIQCVPSPPIFFKIHINQF